MFIFLKTAHTPKHPEYQLRMGAIWIKTAFTHLQNNSLHNMAFTSHTIHNGLLVIMCQVMAHSDQDDFSQFSTRLATFYMHSSVLPQKNQFRHQRITVNITKRTYLSQSTSWQFNSYTMPSTLLASIYINSNCNHLLEAYCLESFRSVLPDLRLLHLYWKVL